MTMPQILSLLLGLFKGRGKKASLILLSVIVFLGYSQHIKSKAYDNGYNKAVAEAKAEGDKLLETRIKALTQEYDEAIAEAQRRTEIAEIAKQELLDRPPEVKYEEIVKIVKTNECDSLSDPYVRLLNNYHGERPKLSE